MAKNDKSAQTKGRSFEVSPKSLTPYEKNSRVHSDEQVDMIAASISEFGFIKPVICDENKMLLAGHGAWMAAKQLDLAKIPARMITGLSDEQKRGFVIADNRSSELSSWDWDLLSIELSELKSLDMDLIPLGFPEFGTDQTTTRREHNVTIGDGRFLLQLEFEHEKEMEKVYDELSGRGIECQILS